MFLIPTHEKFCSYKIFIWMIPATVKEILVQKPEIIQINN